MPEHKKQHYVPQFYLKRFSTDGKRINIWNMQRKKKIYSGSLRAQCYKDYFYGKQLGVEKILGETIEGAVAKIFENIEKHSILPEPLSAEHFTLIIHMLAQHGRTKYAADSLNEVNDWLMRQIYRGKANAEGEQYKIPVKDTPLVSLGLSIQGYPLLLDLNYNLLVNKTEVEFVTSDNPVVFYNQFFSFRENVSSTGVQTKGLQIFLPIDPFNALVFYDPWIYSIENSRGRIVEVSFENDVHAINTLQMCSALNSVYFRDKDFDIDLLFRTASPFLRQTKNDMKIIPGRGTKNRIEELIKVSRQDVRTDLFLSFMRIKIGAKVWRWVFQKRKSQPVVVLRNKRLHAVYEEFINSVKNKEYDVGNFVQYMIDKGIVNLK